MMGRPRCERCMRPGTVCLCAELPAAPLPTRTTVLVLQHPHEARHKLSTLPILRACLSNLHLCIGRRFQPGSFPLLDSLIAFPRHKSTPPVALLLFPGHNAQPLPLWFSRHLASGCPICCCCSPSAHHHTECPASNFDVASPVEDRFHTLVAESPVAADSFRTSVSESSVANTNGKLDSGSPVLESHVADPFRALASESPVADLCRTPASKSGSLFSGSDLVTANSTSTSCDSASAAFCLQATSADFKLGISDSATHMLHLDLDSSISAVRASQLSEDTFSYSNDVDLSLPRSLDSSLDVDLSKVQFEGPHTVGTSDEELDLDTNSFGSVNASIVPAGTCADLDLVGDSNPSSCFSRIEHDTLDSAIISSGVLDTPRVTVDFGQTKAPEAHIVLLVVDATWQHASEMIKASLSYLEKFATPVCLHYDVNQDGNAMANSDLTLRKEPFAGCLTTLEAVATSLRILEPNGSEIEQKLLSVLRRMVHYQSSHISAHKVRNHPRKKKTLSS